MVERGLEPLEEYPGSMVHWRVACRTCGREFQTKYNTVQQGSGCPFCAGKRVDPEEAVAIMLKAGVAVSEPFPGSHKPWPGICTSCGATVRPSYNSISRGQGGCKPCGMKRVGEKLRLPEEVARQRMRLAGLDPIDPYPGALSPWRCTCRDCGRIVRPRYAGISQGERGCRDCGNRRAGAARRADSDHAEDVMRSNDLVPLVPYPGSNAPWPSRCTKCDSEVCPSFEKVKLRGHQCAYCARNRLHPTEASSVMIEAGYEPLEDYPGALVGWRCRHIPCGATVHPRYADIYSGYGACRACANHGFDDSAPGVVYLVRSDEWFALKVGISNSARASRRLEKHYRNGWHLCAIWDFERGADALVLEQRVLEQIRESGAPPAVSKSDMPQGGWTETFSQLRISIRDAIRLVEAGMRLLNEEHPGGREVSS